MTKKFESINTNHHLIPPFSKKTSVHWSLKEDNNDKSWNNELFNQIESNAKKEEGDGLNKKRRNINSECTITTSSTFMSNHNTILPSLPTVENFLNLMDTAPTSPESIYFSAKSASSSQSSLDSILMEEEEEEEEEDLSKKDEIINYFATTNSSPHPKMEELNEQTMTSLSMDSAFKKRSDQLRNKSAPKSADAVTTNYTFRPPIPPRRSSMPLPTPKINTTADVPPLPLIHTKKKDAQSKKSSKSLLDESPWSTFLGLNKKDENNNELQRRAKLGISLGATPKNTKKSESQQQMLKVTENGQVVLLYEMVLGKFQVIAGTPERLFEKLADETTQDLHFIDTYLMYHSSFISSINLLDQLICRFYLGPSPGEYEYFKKWQYTIQIKVLDVIDRWISVQYLDFKWNPELLEKLNSFLYDTNTVLLNHFKHQIEKIQDNLRSQTISNLNIKHIIHSSNSTASSPTSPFNFHLPFVNNATTAVNNSTLRRQSNATLIFNLQNSLSSSISSFDTIFDIPFISMESKLVARYLTLADYYLFKASLSHGLLNTHLLEHNYIDLMTKRSNLLSHWVLYEIYDVTELKAKRSIIKKFIEIAKLCLELNNYHTCMIIIMGLSSSTTKLKEVWESLSNRDTNMFTSLQKLLDVNCNMRYYRQKVQCNTNRFICIPFLPVVLKDQTFYKENPTFLVSTYPNLINFTKFISIREFIDKNNEMMTPTNEKKMYWFVNELTHYPFLPLSIQNSIPKQHSGSLDPIADWVENRLTKSSKLLSSI